MFFNLSSKFRTFINLNRLVVVVMQSLSSVPLFATPCTAACQASLSITKFWSSLKLISNESVMPFNYLILCSPLLLSPSVFPGMSVFSNQSVLHSSWLCRISIISNNTYQSISFSISPSNEYSGLTSFRMDGLILLAVQGTFKSLQHHSSKASILPHSAFFIVQLSHP